MPKLETASRLNSVVCFIPDCSGSVKWLYICNFKCVGKQNVEQGTRSVSNCRVSYRVV